MSDEIVKNPEDQLTKLEAEEYYRWRRGVDITPLSPFVTAKMYQLFLLGHTCDDIVKANESKFSLGLVVDARIRHRWDERRDAYIEQLYDEAAAAVKQRQVEGAVFLADMLAAAHKEYGSKFHKFLQSGDPKDLDDRMKISTITQYKTVVDGLKSITGQDKQRAGSAAPLVNINMESQPISEKIQTTSPEAHSLIDLLNAVDEASPKKKR